MQNDQNNHDSVEKWIGIGAETIGATVSGAIGYLSPTIQGVLGAAVGGVAVSQGLEFVGKELHSRILSKREEKRISTAYYYLQERFNLNVSEGKSIRDDDFFDLIDDEYNKNTEILEGIMLVAQKCYQEKKVPFIANFYANLIFDKTIDSYQANSFLRLAESMSYRQFCLLAVYYYAADFDLDKHNMAPVIRNVRVDTISELIALRDYVFLRTEIAIKNDGRHYIFPPENAYLTEYGKIFCELFGLNEISDDDLLEMAGHLVTAEKVEEVRKRYNTQKMENFKEKLGNC